MWKEVVVAYFEVCLGVCSEGRRRTRKAAIRMDDWSPGRNLYLGSREYETGALTFSRDFRPRSSDFNL
jgi:hypothetical protein